MMTEDQKEMSEFIAKVHGFKKEYSKRWQKDILIHPTMDAIQEIDHAKYHSCRNWQCKAMADINKEYVKIITEGAKSRFDVEKEEWNFSYPEGCFLKFAEMQHAFDRFKYSIVEDKIEEGFKAVYMAAQKLEAVKK